jgi:hypothetical protein
MELGRKRRRGWIRLFCAVKDFEVMTAGGRGRRDG